MVNQGKKLIEIDLNQFKLYISIQGKTDLSLHFNTPSRRFYLSVIALVVNEMKKLGRIRSIPLEEHLHQPQRALLPRYAVGNPAGATDLVEMINIPLVVADQSLLVGVLWREAEFLLRLLDGNK